MCKVNEVGATGSTNGSDLRSTESGQATQGVRCDGHPLSTRRATTNGEVPARECQEERKSPRILRSMPKPGMQPKDALRPRRQSLAGVLLAVAAAITTSLSSPNLSGSGEQFRSEPWVWDHPEVFTSASSPTTKEEDQTTIGVRYQLGGKSNGLGRGGRDGTGRVPGPGRKSSLGLKQGDKIRLSAKAAKSAKLLAMERDTTNAELERARQTRTQHEYLSDLLEMDLSPPVESLHVHHDPQQRAHFAEMFAGEANYEVGKQVRLASNRTSRAKNWLGSWNSQRSSEVETNHQGRKAPGGSDPVPVSILDTPHQYQLFTSARGASGTPGQGIGNVWPHAVDYKRADQKRKILAARKSTRVRTLEGTQSCRAARGVQRFSCYRWIWSIWRNQLQGRTNLETISICQ